MLNLDPNALAQTYVSAVLSASMLRDQGEISRAARIESLARNIVRELLASGDQGEELFNQLLAHEYPAVRALCLAHRAEADQS